MNKNSRTSTRSKLSAKRTGAPTGSKTGPKPGSKARPQSGAKKGVVKSSLKGRANNKRTPPKPTIAKGPKNTPTSSETIAHSKSTNFKSNPAKPNYAKPNSAKSNNVRIEKAPGHWLYGRHCVSAALHNKDRIVLKLCATKQGAQWLVKHGHREDLLRFQAEEYHGDELEAMLSNGATHQGVAAQVELLPNPSLEEIIEDESRTGPILVLDQLTDPQNIGAIFRSAAAFGVRAIVTQDRHTPALTGALAKAAVGTVELVPCVREVNIARALTLLKKSGYFCIGLAGEGSQPLEKIRLDGDVAIVMGAEGSGLRALVAKTCDMLAHIPMSGTIESLNVSAAAAITLYTVQQSKSP